MNVIPLLSERGLRARITIRPLSPLPDLHKNAKPVEKKLVDFLAAFCSHIRAVPLLLGYEYSRLSKSLFWGIMRFSN